MATHRGGCSNRREVRAGEKRGPRATAFAGEKYGRRARSRGVRKAERMIIALAQIDGRLGDIEGICDRIVEQARLAEEAGAHVMCTPTPLFAGILPGALVESPDYLGDLLAALQRTAQSVNITCLVPAVIPCAGSQLFEVFMLKEGRLIPTRTLVAGRRGGDPEDAWAPPVFDVDGVRMGLTFDLERDIDRVPTGTDLIVYFQVGGFDPTDMGTAGVAAVADGHFRDLAVNARRWVACMAPVGAFDEATYTGGSFVMDDNGRVVAAAPCFEEGLVVQEVLRGQVAPAVPQNELPVFHQDAWLWESLVIYLRDNLAARGFTRAAVLLSGDLPTSLAAALAVDALGSRNVTGVLIERERIFTPAQEAAEQDRLAAVRALAANLHIELEEHAAPPAGWLLPDGAAPADADALIARAEQLVADMAADGRGACLVSPLTKTDYALTGEKLPMPYLGAIAPFGDVYLTHLEFLARYRNGVSPVVPARLVTLNAVEERMRQVLEGVRRGMSALPSYAERVAACLARLEATQVDSVLDAHVDRNRGAADITSAALPGEAVRLLLMQVRRGEAVRRMLPPAAIVSARSFAERAWPQALAWSDLGHDGKAERPTVEGLVKAEVERFERNAPDAGERIRGEIIGLLGEILGLDPSEQEQLQSEEGRRRLQEGFERFEQELRRAMGGGGGHIQPPMMPGQMPPGQGDDGFPFFSQN